MRLTVERPIILEARCVMCVNFVQLETEGLIVRCFGWGVTVCGNMKTFEFPDVQQASFLHVLIKCIRLLSQVSGCWLGWWWGLRWGVCEHYYFDFADVDVKMIVHTPLSEECYYVGIVLSRVAIRKKCKNSSVVWTFKVCDGRWWTYQVIFECYRNEPSTHPCGAPVLMVSTCDVAEPALTSPCLSTK